MQIRHIHASGFGTLSNCDLPGIDSGLTVIYGANGSGKTTLLQLIRGIFSGYEQARELKLLPPLRGGTPGGFLSLQNGAGQYQVFRQARTTGHDTLAIALQQGAESGIDQMRASLQALPATLLQNLFLVSGFAAHNLGALVRLAQEYSIPLKSTWQSADWVNGRIREIQRQRQELFQPTPDRGQLHNLQRRREQLRSDLQAAQARQRQMVEAWQAGLLQSQDLIGEYRQRLSWLMTELQMIDSDLSEVQSRIWDRREITIEEPEQVTVMTAPVTPAWQQQIADIDREIASAQQVLRDLAGSRRDLSVLQADISTADVADPRALFPQQRTALKAIETQALALSVLSSELRQASRCLCQSAAERLEQAVQSIRQQIWNLCECLSRQQTTQEHRWLSLQLEGVGRCESELIQQIRRLQVHRDEIVQQSIRSTGDFASCRDHHDLHWCECATHASVTAAPKPVEQTTIVMRSRTELVSAARSDDAARELSLLQRRHRLREEQAHLQELLLAALRKSSIPARSPDDMTSDWSVQTLRNELETVERQLTIGHRQWHTLSVLESLLDQARGKLDFEQPAAVVEQASEFLNEMTSGRYPRFRYFDDSAELRVCSAAGSDLPVQALSRGTLEQAALCFRLALVSEFQNRGTSLPLVLDDILNDSDVHRSSAAVEVLIRAARSQQIIFLTCQEHLLEMFETHGVAVRTFPGTRRPRRTPPETPAAVPVRKSPALPAHDTLPAAVTEAPADTGARAPGSEIHRVQPDEPYWLQPGSPIRFVPSIGEQMARRLTTLGVQDIGDLIDLNLEILEVPLESLQISPSTLRSWQSEARLLCCVPHITGRDAQLLVACGIHSPSELAGMDVRELSQRTLQLRSQEQNCRAFPWLSDLPEWPSHEQLQHWVRSARTARSWRQTRENARRLLRPGARRTVLRGRSGASRLPQDRLNVVRMHREAELQADCKWKFYLREDSAIVDAPSIGPRMAERLNAIGVVLVSDLLNRSADEISQQLNRRDITPEIVVAWQQQSLLMCRVPELRGHDVQVLVACQITDSEMLAGLSPQELFRRVEPFVSSKEGQRLLRTSRTPDLPEVTEWIEYARNSPLNRAA